MGKKPRIDTDNADSINSEDALVLARVERRAADEGAFCDLMAGGGFAVEGGEGVCVAAIEKSR